MRKWRDVQAAGLGLLALCVGGCEPQSIPSPVMMRYGNGGAAAVPAAAVGGAASQVAASGGYIAPPPTAGTYVPPPPPPAAGIGGAIPPPAAGGGGLPIAAMGGTEQPFDAGADPNRNKVVAGMVCERFAAIECAGEAHCCSAPGRTVDACRTAVANSCNQDGYLDAVSLNSITGFDPVTAEASFTTLEQKAAQCDPTIASWGIGNDGLRGMLKGTVAPGASCKPPGVVTGDKALQASALLSCTNITTTACLPKALLGDWTCVPKNDVGGNCVTDYNCIDDEYCSIPPMQSIGKCARRAVAGGSCKNPNECTTLYCEGGMCVPPTTQLAYCLSGS
jgi:hypothetical protein